MEIEKSCFITQSLRAEKENTIAELKKQEQETRKLSKENQSLSHASEQLHSNLQGIEDRIKQVSLTKEKAEERLVKI